MLQSKSLQDEMLRNYIETVFNRYDTDRNGSLDVREMTLFFNDLFRTLEINITVTDKESMEAIRTIDQNSDGLVSKEAEREIWIIVNNGFMYRLGSRIRIGDRVC